MGFKIKQDEYSEIKIHQKKTYIKTPGKYKVKIQAAKVIRPDFLEGKSTGVVEFEILEAPEGTYPIGTSCNWMVSGNTRYKFQQKELKNFTQQALIAKAALDGEEPSPEELEDVGLIDDVFPDPEDEGKEDAVSEAVDLVMTVEYTEKTTKPDKEGKTKTFMTATWV